MGQTHRPEKITFVVHKHNQNTKNSTKCNCCKVQNDQPPTGGGSLDTLAQLGIFGKITPNCAENPSDDVADFPQLGVGTSIKNVKRLAKRAKRKYLAANIAHKLVLMNEAKRELKHEEIHIKNPRLNAPRTPAPTPDGKRKRIFVKIPKYTAHPIDTATRHFENENNERDILRSYRNMYHCNREMVKTSDGTIKANYCKNRLCLVCNSIRTAELINKYQPVMDAWAGNMYMVTLTIENVSQHILPDAIAEMQKVFTKCKDTLKKRFQDGQLPKFEGLRKFECTTQRENDFHPHFHILVHGEECANALREQWVKIVNKSDLISCKLMGWDAKKQKNVYLQDVQPATNGVGKELFKYFTKILSNKDTSDKGKKDNRTVYLHRLDTIFKAMRGKRVFQTFGFKISDYADPIADAKTDQPEMDADLIAFPVINTQDEQINNIWLEYYSNQYDPIAQTLLITRLYNIQHQHILEFMPPQLTKREAIEKLLQTFEKSSRTPSDLDALQMGIKQIDVGLFLDLMEREQPPPDPPPPLDEIFVFNTQMGMWYSTTDGAPLIDYELSQSLKDIASCFKYPKVYRDMMHKIWMQQQQ